VLTALDIISLFINWANKDAYLLDERKIFQDSRIELELESLI